MHDPCTVAFEIPRPWPARYPNGEWYWPALLTIWHVDPCTDGTDDSCGFSVPKLTAAEKKLAKDMAEWEVGHPFFFTRPMMASNPKYPSLYEIGPGDATAFCIEAFRHVAWALDRRGLDHRLLMRAIELGCNQHDGLRGVLAETNPQERERFFYCIIRQYRAATRPWYRRPRWHVWHWRIQVHPWQRFKHWLWPERDQSQVYHHPEA
jgi:hypothetical protein